MKKFTENQVFTNFLKSHPRQQFDLYSGSAYINQRVDQGEQVQAGNLSLYEKNVNRVDDNLIYPFITKDGAKNSFTVTSKASYYSALFGAEISGTYPMTASLSRSYFDQGATPNRYLRALRNTLNYYRGLSTYFDYDNYYAAPANVTLVSIPSIFFDEGIEKGSVKLKFYFTGTLIGELADSRRNGLLIETTGSATGTVAGTVLYNEGFLLLTASHIMAPDIYDAYEGDTTVAPPAWTHWGSYKDTPAMASASSYVLEFKGTNTIPVFTMFAEAGKNEFNYSSNPTFIQHAQKSSAIIDGASYTQPSGNIIKNIAKSEVSNYNAPFKSVTYISKIGIYDKNLNLLGVANLANPVKKTEDVGYTFRITMDI